MSTLPDNLRLGEVHLTVRDLDRAVAWYQSSLGLRVHRHEADVAELGDGNETTVVLHEDPQALPAGRHAGLYHYALLYPSREELARARPAHRRHADADRRRLRPRDARGDLPARRRRQRHRARRRPPARRSGPTHLGYAGGPKPLDVDDLLATVAGEDVAPQVGPGLRMGHVHLHVGDIDEGLRFYRDAIGFDEKAQIADSAAFVSRRRLPPSPRLQHLARPGRPGRAAAPRRPAALDRPAADRADVEAVRARLDDTEPFDGGFLAPRPVGHRGRVRARSPEPPEQDLASWRRDC